MYFGRHAALGDDGLVGYAQERPLFLRAMTCPSSRFRSMGRSSRRGAAACPGIPASANIRPSFAKRKSAALAAGPPNRRESGSSDAPRLACPARPLRRAMT